MLLELEKVGAMYRCPATRKKLIYENGKLVTRDAGHLISYSIIKGYPILIDFEKSILREEDINDLSSVISRHTYKGFSGLLKRILFPPLKATSTNVSYLLSSLLTSKKEVDVLIVGGGTIGQGMEVFYDDPRVNLISFDVYASNFTQFVADAHNIPLPNNCFDLVIVQAVLEHVLEPSIVVSEIHRVLQPDGLVYAETPFLQHVHEGAYDFTRYTESGHRYLFKRFSIIKAGVSMGAGTQLLWSLDNFFRALFRSRNVGKGIKIIFFWLQYLDNTIPSKYNIDAASGVFFLGRKQKKSINAKEMIDYYRGAQ